MERNLEELTVPSPIRTVINASVKNPLFQEALNKIKDPKERKAFLGMFENYIVNAYRKNPGMNRLMKTHDLAGKVAYSPESDYDSRSILDEQLYAEPGRTYQYTNNFLKQEKDKKGLLKKLYYTAKDFTRETLPGIVGMGALGGVKYWHKGMMKARAIERAKSLLVPSHKVWTPGITDYLRNPQFYFDKFILGGRAAAKTLAKNTFVDAVGWALNPALYLLGGYFLYRTIKYFVKKYKQRKENNKLEELNKSVWMQNQLLAQRV